ncbi:MAG: hypothetical protein EPN24_07265 [Candidatus Methanoperedens sp.]|nr:MAG: hypothetical protein EPN24_07265 [Candidatus Methanoperedens sp.]
MPRRLVRRQKRVAGRRKGKRCWYETLMSLGHGRGAAWGWLEINIGDPRMGGGLKPPPFEYQYIEEEEALHNKVRKIAQDVTGRHGDYDGRISLLAQGWRKRQKPEDKAEKEKVSTEGAVVRPVKITPEAPIAIPEVKTPTTRPELEAKSPVKVKPDVYTRKQKRAARKPDIVYTEYGRTVVKKAKLSSAGSQESMSQVRLEGLPRQ